MEISFFEFNLKTRLKFGVGSARNLANDLKELGYTKVALIIDGSIQKLPYVGEIVDNVRDVIGFSNIKIWTYDKKGEPDYDLLDEGKLEFLNANGTPVVDCFVGVGGGSVIDTAKGFATLVVNHGPAITYRGFPENLNEPLPVIALPTTAGTGSEVTYNASFIDRTSKKKMGINTVHNFPRLAILDPLLVLSCPRSVMISSGMDALVHTMESYVAVGANLITRVFAKEAFALLFNNFLPAVNKAGNNKCVANLQLGAYLAGISLFNAGSGIAGALSYPLGVHFNVPHGIAGAVFLHHVIAYNVAHGYDYKELYERIEGADCTLSASEKNKIFAEKFLTLIDALDIPHTLYPFGVTAANAEVLINEVEGLEKAFAQNPISYSAHEAKKLLRSMV